MQFCILITNAGPGPLWPELFILILIFPENLNLYLQSELPRTIKQANAKYGRWLGWQGFILRSGIEKNEIIHSLIKHSFEREKRMEYSKKGKLIFSNKTFFNIRRKLW